MGLTRVFEPVQVGPVEIPNRIARMAHGTAFSTPRELIGGEEFVAYHVARAKGGVGLTILEAIAVHRSSGGLIVSDERTVERYQQLAEAVRPHGMRLFQQLFHTGYKFPALDGGPPWAVSTVPTRDGTVGTPMTKAQIAELVGAYAAAARRCRDGGLDGIELHAAHSYLPAQFLSPILNTRSDEYGGSFENRLRFTVEVLQAIRAEAGDGLAVGIRLGVSALPGNVTEDDLRNVIQRLERDGLIDFVTTSMGDHYRSASLTGGMD